MAGSELRIPNLIAQAPDIESPPAPLTPKDYFVTTPAPLRLEGSECLDLPSSMPRRRGFGTAFLPRGRFGPVCEPRNLAALFSKRPPVLFVPPQHEILPYEPPPAGEEPEPAPLALWVPQKVPASEPKPARLVHRPTQALSSPIAFNRGGVVAQKTIGGKTVFYLTQLPRLSQRDYGDDDWNHCGRVSEVYACNYWAAVTGKTESFTSTPLSSRVSSSWTEFASQSLQRAGLSTHTVDYKGNELTLCSSMLRSIQAGRPFLIHVDHGYGHHVVLGIGASEDGSIILIRDLGRVGQDLVMAYNSQVKRHVPGLLNSNSDGSQNIRFLTKADETINPPRLANYQKNHQHLPWEKGPEGHICQREGPFSEVNKRQVGFKRYEITRFTFIDPLPMTTYRPLFASSR